MTLAGGVAIEAALARETKQVFIALIDLSHPTWLDTLYYANNTEDVISNGITYVESSFNLTRPTETEGVPQSTLTLSNIKSEAGTRIRAARNSRILVNMQVVLAASPDTVRKAWPGFELINGRANDIVATGTLTQRQYARELWPPRRMTASNGFPWMAKLK